MTQTTLPPVRPPATPPSGPPLPPGRSTVVMTVGVVLLAVGVLSLLATLGVEVRATWVAPGLLMLLGLGVIVSGIRGEPHNGMVALAIVLGVLLAVGATMGAVLDVPVRGGVGERRHHPTAATLEDEYRMLIGSLVVDLRDVAFSAGTTTVELSTVMGEVELWLPDDIPVRVEADVAGGAARVLGTVQEGLAVDHAIESEGWAGAERRLLVDVGVGLGEIRVHR